MPLDFTLLCLIDNPPAVAEVHQNYHKFGEDKVRQYPGSAHIEITDILLRGPDRADMMTMHQALYCEDYDNMRLFPQIRELVEMVQTKVVDATKVGRVLVTRLKPNGKIHPHIDEGPVPEFYSRYHYVIQGDRFNMFTIDNSKQRMVTGQLWQVNVQKTHSVENCGKKDRIHLIMDMA